MPTFKGIAALLLPGDQAKLSRERYELLLDQITQLVYRQAFGLTNFHSRSRSEMNTVLGRQKQD